MHASFFSIQTADHPAFRATGRCCANVQKLPGCAVRKIRIELHRFIDGSQRDGNCGSHSYPNSDT